MGRGGLPLEQRPAPGVVRTNSERFPACTAASWLCRIGNHWAFQLNRRGCISRDARSGVAVSDIQMRGVDSHQMVLLPIASCACLVRRREWDTSPLGTAPDLVLWGAEPIQNYIVEGCPGMIACSSHSPWPFWPVSPPFWSCPLAVSAVFLRDPVRFSVWLFTEWAVCGLVEEGEEGSVRSKPSDPLFNRARTGNEVENDLR